MNFFFYWDRLCVILTFPYPHLLYNSSLSVCLKDFADFTTVQIWKSKSLNLNSEYIWHWLAGTQNESLNSHFTIDQIPTTATWGSSPWKLWEAFTPIRPIKNFITPIFHISREFDVQQIRTLVSVMCSSTTSIQYFLLKKGARINKFWVKIVLQQQALPIVPVLSLKGARINNFWVKIVWMQLKICAKPSFN